MRFIVIPFLLVFYVPGVFSAEPTKTNSPEVSRKPSSKNETASKAKSRPKRQRKKSSRINKSLRNLNSLNLTPQEAQLRDTLLEIVSSLDELPNICSDNKKSLYKKAMSFQRQMDLIKGLSLTARELIYSHQIPYDHPVRGIFSVNIFYSFVFEDIKLNYRKPLSRNNQELKKQIQDLSFSLQHNYKVGFNQSEDVSVEEFPVFINGIARALECLSNTPIPEN